MLWKMRWKLRCRMCRRLKADPETRDIKVIVMTSLYKGQRYRSEAMANFGADGYLGKPLDPELLATTLRVLFPTPENK